MKPKDYYKAYQMHKAIRKQIDEEWEQRRETIKKELGISDEQYDKLKRMIR